MTVVYVCLLLLIFVALWYYRKSKSVSNNPTRYEHFEIVNEINKRPSFTPSDKFTGKRPGYVFKMDDLGLGYYVDPLQVVD
jgi:hypothetical protein